MALRTSCSSGAAAPTSAPAGSSRATPHLADPGHGSWYYAVQVTTVGGRKARYRRGGFPTTGHPVQSWVVQQARNLLMDLDDAGMSVKFVLHDRDASFTAAFGAVFQAAGARVLRSAVQAPRMNAVMERWIGSNPSSDNVTQYSSGTRSSWIRAAA